MLQIALAGLVLQGLLKIEEAEYVDSILKDKPVPQNVTEVIRAIQILVQDFRKKNPYNPAHTVYKKK